MTKTQMEIELRALKNHGFAQHRMIIDLQQRMNAVLKRINSMEQKNKS